MEATADKQRAHDLIDQLDAPMVRTAVRLLECIARDPIARSIATAPVDDEPLSEEDVTSLRRSEAWFRNNDGKGTAMEDVLAEFGLSMKDFPPTTNGA